MNIVIKIIGIFFVLMAILCFLKPAALKSLIEFFAKGNRMYVAGLIRFALAVVFLLAARECRKPWVIFALGILLLLGGLLIFLIGPKRLRPILEWLQKQSSLLLRVLALAILAVGIVIIIFA